MGRRVLRPIHVWVGSAEAAVANGAGLGSAEPAPARARTGGLPAAPTPAWAPGHADGAGGAAGPTTHHVGESASFLAAWAAITVVARSSLAYRSGYAPSVTRPLAALRAPYSYAFGVWRLMSPPGDGTPISLRATFSWVGRTR